MGQIANEVNQQLSGGSGNAGNTPSAGELYRVRKSWDDAKSQIGAFKNLDNARKCVKDNNPYHIYDEHGNKVE
jgi:hypothetical protein